MKKYIFITLVLLASCAKQEVKEAKVEDPIDLVEDSIDLVEDPIDLQGHKLGKWLDQIIDPETGRSNPSLSSVFIITENPTNILTHFRDNWIITPAVEIEKNIYAGKENYESDYSDYADAPLGKWDEAKGEYSIPYESAEDYRDSTVEFFRIKENGDLRIGAGLQRIKARGRWTSITAKPID